MKGKLIWAGMLLDIQGQLSCLLFLSSHIVLSGQFGQRGDFFFSLCQVSCPVFLCTWAGRGAVLGLLGCEWGVLTVVLEPLCPWEQARGKAQSRGFPGAN